MIEMAEIEIDEDTDEGIHEGTVENILAELADCLKSGSVPENEVAGMLAAIEIIKANYLG